MHIWQKSQNGGADDDDDDYDEDEEDDEYNWNDDDTRIGQAHQYGEEDYYTDDENDLEAPRIGARPTLGGGQKGRGGENASGGQGDDDDDDDDTKGDIGHWLAGLFKGATVGRKIKRLVLNFTGWQLFFGFSLLVIACDESTNYQPGVGTGWFTTIKFGSSVLNLTWVVAFPSFGMSLLSIFAMRNWASLVTNRELFQSLLRIYLVFFVLMFLLAAWGLAVTFGIFNNVDFNKINPVINPYGLFIATVVFLIPYSLVLLYYILDLHYLIEEMEHGTIKELGKTPKGTMDLTGVTISNSCGLFLCGIPFMVLFQLGEIVHELLSMVCGEYMARSDRWTDGRERSKKKGVCYRIVKTLRNRCCCFCCPMGGGGSSSDKGSRYGGKVASDDDGEGRREREQAASLAAQEKKAKEEAEKEMKAKELEEKKRQSEERELERKRQQEEDQERDRQQAERDRIEDERDAASRAEMEEEARRAAEEYAQRMKEQEELEKARKIAKEKKEADRKAKEEADKKKKAEDEAKKKEEVFKPVLSLQAFKTHWAKLAPSGSFQCHLKVMPDITVLSNHLKKQGFHVVFSNTAKDTGDVEVGFCNVRKDPAETPGAAAEPLFMARFVASGTNFNAVMKSEDVSNVPMYVKKYALAKVLKIDTTAGAGGGAGGGGTGSVK